MVVEVRIHSPLIADAYALRIGTLKNVFCFFSGGRGKCDSRLLKTLLENYIRGYLSIFLVDDDLVGTVVTLMPNVLVQYTVYNNTLGVYIAL